MMLMSGERIQTSNWLGLEKCIVDVTGGNMLYKMQLVERMYFDNASLNILSIIYIHDFFYFFLFFTL